MHLRLVRHWWPVSDPLYVSPRLLPVVYPALLALPLYLALSDLGKAAAAAVAVLLEVGLVVYSARLTRRFRAAHEPRFPADTPTSGRDARVMCCGEGVQLSAVQGTACSTEPLRAYTVVRPRLLFGMVFALNLFLLVVQTWKLRTTGTPEYTLPPEWTTPCLLTMVLYVSAPFWCNLLWGTIVEVTGSVLTLRRWCLWWPGPVLRQVDLREASVECRFDDMKLFIGPTAHVPAGLKISLWQFVRPHRLAAAVLRAAEG